MNLEPGARPLQLAAHIQHPILCRQNSGPPMQVPQPPAAALSAAASPRLHSSWPVGQKKTQGCYNVPSAGQDRPDMVTPAPARVTTASAASPPLTVPVGSSNPSAPQPDHGSQNP